MGLVLLLGLSSLSACSCDDEQDDPEGASDETADEGSPSEINTDDEDTVKDTKADKTRPLDPASEEARTTSSGRAETRTQRLHRIASAPLDTEAKFDVDILSMQLIEGKSKDRYGKKSAGVQLWMNGYIRNMTGRTLTEGYLAGVLVLRFGDDVVKVRMSPDGFKPSVSPERPWRHDTQRLFNVETYVFPDIMLEYVPETTEARVFVAFVDPLDYEIEASIWQADINWLAARVAPVKGQAQVFKAESIRAGLKGKAIGKLENGETVELLYQSRDWYRIRAKDQVGWVSNKAILVSAPQSIYEGAQPHGGGDSASDGEVEIAVTAMANAADVPSGVRLADGERFLLASVTLENKGEKAIKCSDFFVDYGAKNQRGVARESELFDGALECEGGKLDPGSRASGKIAFRRKRHDLPVAVGYMSPSKEVLSVDVYDPAFATPYTL